MKKLSRHQRAVVAAVTIITAGNSPGLVAEPIEIYTLIRVFSSEELVAMAARIETMKSAIDREIAEGALKGV